MFEDSLMESRGQIRTRSRWYAVGSFFAQAALVGVLVLVPYMYPAALPKQALSILLTAPPPPPAPPSLPQQAAAAQLAARPILIATTLVAPRLIPQHAAQIVDAPALVDPNAVGFSAENHGNGPLDGLLGPNTPVPAPRVVEAKPRGPVRISAGVATGQLLSPIRPVYPQIARAAHLQGTVVVAATISKTGTIENLRVLDGPPMLRQAAIDAIAQARYAPYKLSGEPVEVETTINVVFTLGN
jgi:protein TonB